MCTLNCCSYTANSIAKLHLNAVVDQEWAHTRHAKKKNSLEFQKIKPFIIQTKTVNS